MFPNLRWNPRCLHLVLTSFVIHILYPAFQDDVKADNKVSGGHTHADTPIYPSIPIVGSLLSVA